MMNYSRQRELILETLKENVVHPTAEYLYEKVREKDKNISLATLYRNLNKLAQMKLIRKIDGLENSAHFDHNIHEHYHFICDKCGKVFDVDCDIAPETFKQIENNKGCLIKGHDITFHGLCSECKGGNQ